jgi:hypothetical protein
MNIPEVPASKQQPVRIQDEVTDSQLLTGHLGTAEALPRCQDANAAIPTPLAYAFT